MYPTLPYKTSDKKEHNETLSGLAGNEGGVVGEEEEPLMGLIQFLLLRGLVVKGMKGLMGISKIQC